MTFRYKQTTSTNFTRQPVSVRSPVAVRFTLVAFYAVFTIFIIGLYLTTT